MLAMYMNSVSILYGSPACALAMTRVHQAVRGDRGVPGECLVDADGCAVVVEQQVFGAARIAERHAGQHRHRLRAFTDGAGDRRDGARERRFVAPGPRRIDRAQQHLQHMDVRGRYESRWSGPRCRAWRASRPGGRSLSRAGGPACRSRAGQLDGLIKGGVGELAGDAADRGGGDAAAICHRLRRVAAVQVAFGQQMEHRRAGGHRGA